jgi:drug/metabolite transporter (DMT)-like permease
MVNELRRRPRTVARVLLLVTSMVWGTTFVVVKAAIAHTPVLDFLAWRFLLAGVLLAALRPRAVLRLGGRGVAQGLALGGVLAAAYLLQTYGLRSTPAAVSGFLTGLQVVFTPLAGWLLLRHRPCARTWGAAAVAMTGLAVLSLRAVAFGGGDALTVASAVLFAVQMVALGRWASADDAYGLATVQLLTVGLVALVGAAPGGLDLPLSVGAWAAVAITAVGATAFAFVVQSWAQSHVSAMAAAVVYTTEPLFAALFAWVAGEQMGWAVAAGGALVVAAMFVLGIGGARDAVAPGPVRPEAVPVGAEEGSETARGPASGPRPREEAGV